jgi:uncharacterized protein YqeY
LSGEDDLIGVDWLRILESTIKKTRGHRIKPQTKQRSIRVYEMAFKKSQIINYEMRSDHMALKETILAEIKTAMKSQAAVRLSALRFLQSAVKNKEIELRPNTISDQDIIAVVKKICNQHKDSIEQYTSAGRHDLVDQEKAQLVVLEEFLPKQLSREELEKMVTDVIKEVGASSIKDMGNVIKATIAKTGGAADNRIVSEIVKAKLVN